VKRIAETEPASLKNESFVLQITNFKEFDNKDGENGKQDQKK